MLLSSTLALVGLGACANARFQPRDVNEDIVHLHDLAPKDIATPSIQQDASGKVPYFDYEKLTVSPTLLNGLLQTKLGQAALGKYLNVFKFANQAVTSSTSTPVTYNLKGPGNCKVFPGDAAWPMAENWSALKMLSGGALLKPLPQAHICYANTGGSPESAACQAMGASWADPYFHLDDPVEMLSALYQGMTCQPTSVFNKTNTCEQGGYPTYVLNVTTVAQIQLAVNFARNTGIRIVIKNTGHDFSGKSGGAGSLSVWTHHLKKIAYLPAYKDKSYSGPAMKIAVGVQGFELYAAANKLGVIAMGGECPTVSPPGGWVQGGGHSPVSSLWGMGADQALGFEVVTSDGRFVTANRDQNADLYWALRGGGGSTFGIVTSVIFRVHKDLPVTAVSWAFGTSDGVSADTFKAGLKAYFATFVEGADAGIYSYFNVFNFGGAMTFTMAPYFAANKTEAQTHALLDPYFEQLKTLGIDVTPTYKSFDGFYSAYNSSFPVEGVNNKGVVTASRMFPRENWANETIFNATYEAFWGNIEAGMALIGYNIAPTYTRGGRQDTPVNPAWRNAVGYMITGVVQDLTQAPEQLVAQRQKFTDTTMAEWKAITPGSGAYLNEADRLQPNFQWSFWGGYYPKLLEIKKKYDPTNLFFAHTAVGSEFYEVRSFDGYPNENGKVCVKANPELYYAEGPTYVPS